MNNRFRAVKGSWQLGHIRLESGKDFVIGEGRIPTGFKDWEAVRKAITEHADFGRLTYSLPDPEEVRKEALASLGKVYTCPYCDEVFPDKKALQAHLLTCAGEEEQRYAGGLEVKPLTVPDAAKEEEAVAEQEAIRKADAEEEARIKEEKKAQNEAKWGTKEEQAARKAAGPKKPGETKAKTKK